MELIERFVGRAVFPDRFCIRMDEGTPQGGPLIPILANIYLDRFNKLMEKRGYRFVRCGPPSSFRPPESQRGR